MSKKKYTISDPTVGSFTFVADYNTSTEGISGSGVFTPSGSSSSHAFSQMTGVYEAATGGDWAATLSQTKKSNSCMLIYNTNDNFGAPSSPFYLIYVGQTAYKSTANATISVDS